MSHVLPPCMSHTQTADVKYFSQRRFPFQLVQILIAELLSFSTASRIRGLCSVLDSHEDRRRIAAGKEGLVEQEEDRQQQQQQRVP